MQSLTPSQVKEVEMQAPLVQVNWLLLQVSYLQPNSSLPSPQSFTRSQLGRKCTNTKRSDSKVDKQMFVHTQYQLTGKGAGCKARLNMKTHPDGRSGWGSSLAHQLRWHSLSLHHTRSLVAHILDDLESRLDR